ncbi:unnamed protein product [Toxocara canis]|uniref:Uncharacterized protein n=1 Tax=Toxocara canis TaxID=6265 RepID=A0A183UA70_TOXCA|nr:unnamed protein product [Toxocara canis]
MSSTESEKQIDDGKSEEAHHEERTALEIIEEVQKREGMCLHGNGDIGEPIEFGEEKPAGELLDKILHREGMALHGNGESEVQIESKLLKLIFFN